MATARSTPLNDHWQTPPGLLKAVRRVMPIFDLDPATSPDNPTGALRWHTGAPGDCGLEAEWSGDVWLNHPYSQTASWLCKLYQALGAQPSLRVVNLAPMAILSNQGTKGLLRPCYILPVGRVKFIPPEALKLEREAMGKRADPGAPRSDVALFLYRFQPELACSLAKDLDTNVLELHRVS